MRIARKWVGSQPDLPGGFELTRGETPREDIYVFLVDKFHSELSTNYRLLVLGVSIATGDLNILNERRDYVRTLVGEDTWAQWMSTPRVDSQAMADAMEEKLFAAFKESCEAKPAWFLRITPPRPYARTKGVAAIAQVLVGGKPVRVPVHINGSARARAEYIETHESNVKSGMAVVTIDKSASPEKIRKRLFSELGQKRQLDCDFEALLKKFGL